MDTTEGYFHKHAEQAFIAKAMAFILLIIFAKEFLSGLIAFFIILFPLLFLCYIRYQMALTRSSFFSILKQHVTLIPVMRTEEERKNEKIPWVTYSLILCNFLVFYCFQSSVDVRFITESLILLPEQPTFWNLPVSALTSMFLHSGTSHLWGNMTFLWVVGSAVERRIDSSNFLFLYLFTGLMGGILYVLVEFLAHDSPGHMLGASGAIAGVMGIFVIRCYFKSMIFPLPILGIFSLLIPLSLKIRLNSLVIIGLFFYSDLSGGLAQLAGKDSPIGHWVHLGGMITGMIAAAFFLRLGEEAIEERHLGIGMKAVETTSDLAEGERSIKIALEHNPDSGEAVLTLARLKTKFSAPEEGGELYRKALALLVNSDPELATKAFREYCQKYTVPLDPRLLERLGYAALKLKERDVAARCFGLFADLPGISPKDRERVLFLCGKALEEMGEFERAMEQFGILVQEFPDADVAGKLRQKLAAFGTPPAASTPPDAGAREDSIKHETPKAVPRTLSPRQSLQFDAPSCPACAAVMVQRRAISGAQKGALFWVCSSFPGCRQAFPASAA